MSSAPRERGEQQRCRSWQKIIKFYVTTMPHSTNREQSSKNVNKSVIRRGEHLHGTNRSPISRAREEINEFSCQQHRVAAPQKERERTSIDNESEKKRGSRQFVLQNRTSSRALARRGKLTSHRDARPLPKKKKNTPTNLCSNRHRLRGIRTHPAAASLLPTLS